MVGALTLVLFAWLGPSEPVGAAVEEPPAAELADTAAQPSVEAVTTPAPTPRTQRSGRLRFRFFDPQAWVPNAWPTRQTCDLDPSGAPMCVLVRTDVFAGWRASSIGGAQQSEFRIDRAEVGSGLVWRPLERLHAGAMIDVEAVRSAGPQSLTGIDGDSLIVRLLDAYGHVAVRLGPIDLGARAGLVPERWIEQVEKGYDTRGIDALPSDRARFFDRADVGFSLTASGWNSRVDLDLEVVNGEGRAQRERNRGKNTTTIATVRPVVREHAQGPIVLALHGAFRDGSVGLGSAADRRGAAAVTFASPWVYAGFEYVHALGYGGRGDLTANTLGAWVSGRILPRWLGAFAKYDRTQQDLARAGTAVDSIGVGVFSDVFPHVDRNRRRVRLYAAYQHDGYGRLAAPLPGAPAASDTHRFLIQLEIRALARLGMTKP